MPFLKASGGHSLKLTLVLGEVLLSSHAWTEEAVIRAAGEALGFPAAGGSGGVNPGLMCPWLINKLVLQGQCHYHLIGGKP